MSSLKFFFVLFSIIFVNGDPEVQKIQPIKNIKQNLPKVNQQYPQNGFQPNSKFLQPVTTYAYQPGSSNSGVQPGLYQTAQLPQITTYAPAYSATPNIQYIQPSSTGNNQPIIPLQSSVSTNPILYAQYPVSTPNIQYVQPSTQPISTQQFYQPSQVPQVSEYVQPNAAQQYYQPIQMPQVTEYAQPISAQQFYQPTQMPQVTEYAQPISAQQFYQPTQMSQVTEYAQPITTQQFYQPTQMPQLTEYAQPITTQQFYQPTQMPQVSEYAQAIAAQQLYQPTHLPQISEYAQPIQYPNFEPYSLGSSFQQTYPINYGYPQNVPYPLLQQSVTLPEQKNPTPKVNPIKTIINQKIPEDVEIIKPEAKALKDDFNYIKTTPDYIQHELFYPTGYPYTHPDVRIHPNSREYPSKYVSKLPEKVRTPNGDIKVQLIDVKPYKPGTDHTRKVPKISTIELVNIPPTNSEEEVDENSIEATTTPKSSISWLG